ncbi:hypothetical protein Tco_0607616, partial [Tanacetum coccineum]
MVSSSCVTQITIKFHYGGVFKANSVLYDFEGGLRSLKNDDGVRNYRQYALRNNGKIDIYMIHSEFSEHITTDNDGSESEEDDYDVYSVESSDNDDTASFDHLYDGEDEVVDEVGPDDEFNVKDHDKLGDHWPIHNPNMKWKFMRPILGERNGGKRLVVRCSRGNHRKTMCPYRLWASWMQKERSFHVKTLVDEHTCSRTYEYGSLITCNRIAKNYAKRIMTNPNMKLNEIQEAILKKYKCRVTFGQPRRGKIKALEQYETCLEDHYAKLWSYAQEIMTSNPGSTCLMGVNPMPDGKTYFKCFYVCFKGLKQGWLEGCRRVIGLDGCFLKTICKGELLSAVGRDGNNQVYPIAWAVVNIENKENWKWFMQCLIDDLGIHFGEGLTIISDQHKGLIEAAKEVMPFAEHRQCARHIYANFRKKFTGVLYRNLFWKAAKASYPAKFQEVMNEIKDLSKDAYQHLMDRQPKSWSRAFFETDRACDAVENGISECFNSLIVDARKKPIINMLEDIRIYIMERQKRMRDKHVLWSDEICPNIRKKVEIIKDKHRDWRVIPSGGSKFEVRNGYEAFKVDEMNMTCSCRQWQLTGIPCAHGCAAIYFLHKDPDKYVSD